MKISGVCLNQSETAEMKELLEGKSLLRWYNRREAQNTFDERWVKTAFFGIENCEGELKEAIGQLLLLL